MREVVIVEGVRTAVGKRKGSFSNYRSDQLAAVVLKDLLKRSPISKDLIEDVILGCVTQVNEQGGNVARTAALIAGFPTSVPGVTIDRQCGSSQQAVHFAAQAIAAGDMDIVIAGGVENMTRIPMFSNMLDTKPSKQLTASYEIVNQGISAEKIADKWSFTREKLDRFSYQSHQNALAALKGGQFNEEIRPVVLSDKDASRFVFWEGEGPREDTPVEALSGFDPVFKENGKITAGNASQMRVGASAV